MSTQIPGLAGLQRLPKAVGRGVSEWLWPSRCGACDLPHRPGSTGPGSVLCAACEATLVSGIESCCPICGLVWADEPPEGGVSTCGPCLQGPPRFARARAAYGYGGAMRDLIQRWKNGGQESLTPGLGRMLAEATLEMDNGRWPQDTVVVPVPSTRSRVWVRGMNPAGVLASAVARRRGMPLALGLTLKRKIPKARGMNRKARKARVVGVFRGVPKAVAGRPVLLVDDVMTTGATADAAALALRKAGARYVEVASLARVVW